MWEGYVCLFPPQFLTFSESKWLAIIQVIKILAWVTRSYRIWSHPHCRFILLKICILHSRILNSFLNVLFYFPLFSIPFYTTLIYLKKKKSICNQKPSSSKNYSKRLSVSRIHIRSLLCTSPLPHISILHLSQLLYLILHETSCMLFTLPNTMSFTSRNVQKMWVKFKSLNFVIFLMSILKMC